jgi:SEC-C motif-containing protein
MRSRYSAYALGLAEYIIHTTHPTNSDFTDDRTQWRDEIIAFSRGTQFHKLTIISFTDGEVEAYVTFEASLSSGMLKEKSRFLKEAGRWLYVEGDFEI